MSLATVGGFSSLVASGRHDALVVVDGVAGAKEGAQTAPAREALAEAQLVLVRVDGDLRHAVGADGEEAHRRVRAVVELVRAVRADREGDHLALGQDAPAVGRAHVRRALKDDQHLLLAEVEVVGVGGLAGRQLPQAEADARRGELVAETGAPAGEPGVAARLVELRLAEVGHAWVLSRGLVSRPRPLALAELRGALNSIIEGREVGAVRARVVVLRRVRLGGAIARVSQQLLETFQGGGSLWGDYGCLGSPPPPGARGRCCETRAIAQEPRRGRLGTEPSCRG